MNISLSPSVKAPAGSLLHGEGGESASSGGDGDAVGPEKESAAAVVLRAGAGGKGWRLREEPRKDTVLRAATSSRRVGSLLTQDKARQSGGCGKRR